MLTQVYLRSNPFTHVCSSLSMFYPIYRCLRQLTRLTLLTLVYPNLSTLYPGKINRVHSYLEKGFRRNVHAKILKGKMGHDKYTVPDSTDTAVVEPTFLLSFSTRRHTSMASRVILSNFFEEQWQYLSIPFPQYFSGLSRAYFPTTFFKIAVYHPSVLLSYFLCDSYWRLDYRSVYIVISVAYYPLSFLNSQHLYFCLRLSRLNRSFKDWNN